MKYFILSFLSLVFISCNREIRQNDIALEKGFYVNTLSGKKLDGKCQIVYTDPNQFVHKTERTFKNGEPIGNWSTCLNDESSVYQKGKYINEPSLLKAINNLAQSKRSDVNHEFDRHGDILTIDLIYPVNTDKTTLESIVEAVKNDYSEYESLNKLIITKMSDKLTEVEFD